jgi:hypothetical protein
MAVYPFSPPLAICPLSTSTGTIDLAFIMLVKPFVAYTTFYRVNFISYFVGKHKPDNTVQSSGYGTDFFFKGE